MNPLRRLRDDERGMMFVFVGLGFLAFLAATMLAVDVGMLMTARAQAQNSADAGALGGEREGLGLHEADLGGIESEDSEIVDRIPVDGADRLVIAGDERLLVGYGPRPCVHHHPS